MSLILPSTILITPFANTKIGTCSVHVRSRKKISELGYFEVCDATSTSSAFFYHSDYPTCKFTFFEDSIVSNIIWQGLENGLL